MAHMLIMALVALSAVQSDATAVQSGRGYAGKQREHSLLQAYSAAYNAAASKGKSTPVTRVVNLLKEMSSTLDKEMEEDEGLYKKLSCWCNDNVWAKKNSAEANTEKIESLTGSIEMLTAKSSGLKTKIAELEAEAAADKTALAEASALRKKQLKEFHNMELDNIAAIENLKGAIVILSKHQDAAFPQLAMSLLQVKKDSPFGSEHEDHMDHAFDEFLRTQNFHLSAQGLKKAPESKFLQTEGKAAEKVSAVAVGDWSAQDVVTLRKAMKTASSLLQARQGYTPSYNAASGEIFGVMKQLMEEMKGDLSEAQKTEATRAATFAELRAAKTSEIESGEKMAEAKEDEKAETDNALAEAKEDLGQTQKGLADDEKFLGNMEKTCTEAGANFEKRKAARLSEIQAVAQTIEILTGDEARDAMDTTFSFVQTAAEKNQRKLRQRVATLLRRSKSPALSMLATAVELDAFTKVKEEIDKMIATLKTQNADEVKKNQWCKDALQENEMTTMKTKDLKLDLEAKIGSLESTIKSLTEEIEAAKLAISEVQVALQRASANRKQENMDFQKTVADQTATAEVLNKALDKLAKFYDEAAFTQLKKQAPPVPQMEYKKSSGAGGVMSMIEKLIFDTKDITAKSKTSENEAQAAYEALVADTNESNANLNKEVVTKTKAKAGAKKDLSLTQSDLGDAVTELEELGKTNADLHNDCDYVMKNFMIRQKARSEEVEALQQAKQILSGADLR